MPKGCSKPKPSESESDSDSSSVSSTTDSVKMYMIKQKHHGHKHKKHHKSHKECKSETESETEKCSEKKDSSSEDSECSHKEKCNFEDIYKYYKNQLLQDETLQVAGSDSYITSYNASIQNIVATYPVNFDFNDLSYNIEHPRFDAPFTVRNSGIYVLFFITTVQQSAQFTLFINGQPNIVSTTGNNAGSSQTVFRQMYQLNKDDVLVIKNYESTANSLNAPLYVGGLLAGNNATFLLMKIAALPSCENKRLCDSWNPECLSRRKLYLFKKLQDKLLCDKELMLKGYDVHGSFWTKNPQNWLTESSITFDVSGNVNGLSWSTNTPDQIKVCEDGIYKLFFYVNTTTSVQIAFAINGAPIDSTIMGANKGAGQTSIRTLLPLKKGDIITVLNHTSANGQVVVQSHSGGSLQSISAILTVFKAAPLCKPVIVPDCKINNHYKKCYEKFKCFLLANKCLQLTGTDSYFNYAALAEQVVQVNDKIQWDLTTLQENVCHRQATTNLVIEKDGIYDIFADIITGEPSQFTLFINDVPDDSTISGRDSGANKCLLRQFVKLNKGDVIDVRNYSSFSVNVSTSLNSGGRLPGIPAFFMGFKLSNIEEECKKKPSKK